MSREPLEPSIDNSVARNGADEAQTNPILSHAKIYIRDTKTTRANHNAYRDLRTENNCNTACSNAVNVLYNLCNPQAKDIINSMISELATCSSEESKSQFSIALEPFPIMIKGQIQEVYDFKAKKISICPIALNDQDHTTAPKPEFISYLMHEVAHAFDHKTSIPSRSDNDQPVETISYKAVDKAIRGFSSHPLSTRLNCLADLVDSTGSLKTNYLATDHFAQDPKNPDLAYIKTEFLAFSFENAFNNIANGHSVDQFRDCTIKRLAENHYDPATIAWAQSTLNSLSETFLAKLPEKVKGYVGPYYNSMLDQELNLQVHQEQQGQAGAIAAALSSEENHLKQRGIIALQSSSAAPILGGAPLAGVQVAESSSSISHPPSPPNNPYNTRRSQAPKQYSTTSYGSFIAPVTPKTGIADIAQNNTHT